MIAERSSCRNCGSPIVRPPGDEWFHSDTGDVPCWLPPGEQGVAQPGMTRDEAIEHYAQMRDRGEACVHCIPLTEHCKFCPEVRAMASKKEGR